MILYRDNGAIGALLDEYEKAVLELDTILSSLSFYEFTFVVDRVTSDDDCRSIQTIMRHIIRSGYIYVDIIRENCGERKPVRTCALSETIGDCRLALRDMFNYNVLLFEDYPNIELEAHDINDLMKVGWGQYYDVEQLMEHAIVHILRHRRQIERFIIKMK